MNVIEYEEALNQSAISSYCEENFNLKLPQSFVAEFEYMQNHFIDQLTRAFEMTSLNYGHAETLVVSPQTLRLMEAIERTNK